MFSTRTHNAAASFYTCLVRTCKRVLKLSLEIHLIKRQTQHCLQAKWSIECAASVFVIQAFAPAFVIPRLIMWPHIPHNTLSILLERSLYTRLLSIFIYYLIILLFNIPSNNYKKITIFCFMFLIWLEQVWKRREQELVLGYNFLLYFHVYAFMVVLS